METYKEMDKQTKKVKKKLNYNMDKLAKVERMRKIKMTDANTQNRDAHDARASKHLF